MTNMLSGALSAHGLSRADRDALEQLLVVYGNRAPRNHRLASYYECRQPTPSIGMEVLPDSVNPGARCDWARKAVTSVSERVRLDGFSFPGGADDPALAAVVRSCRLVDSFNRHVASELTHGCIFAVVGRGADGHAYVRIHTAEDSAAIWDHARQRIAAGFTVADARRTGWSPNAPVPVQLNMYLPGRMVVLRRSGSCTWRAEALSLPMERPMMEALCYRPTGTKPLGQSRITPAVTYLVDEVERTLRYMAVSSALYSRPARYIMGLSEEQFDELVKNGKWGLTIGSMLLGTMDADGHTPTTGQFPATSPQPYIEAIQAYGKMFSGATGVPLNSLGIVQDNPSSAEAIAAQREDVCVAAEDCIETNRAGLREVALMAMAVEENRRLEDLSDEQKAVMPHFKDPLQPNLAARADAMVKIAGALPGFAGTRYFLEALGMDPADIDRVVPELRANQARQLAQSLSLPRGGPTAVSADAQQG